jgi:haloacetate dehalogenase
VSWHKIAPSPAQGFTIVAPDLRGWAIPTGHYPAEHRPGLVHDPFWRFFAGGEPVPFAAWL